MDKFLVNTSIVIIANQHNPTILHDSVLRTNEIIDPSYVLNNSEQFCTPTLSSIRYENGISFLVDNMRLQIKNDSTGIDPNNPYVDNLAINYIRKVPLVKYESIGLNALFFIKKDDPDEYLKNNFLKNNSIINNKFSIDLKYHITEIDGLLNISLSSGKLVEDLGIISDFNNHFIITKEYKIEDIINYINKFSEKLKLFEDYIDKLFNV